MRIRAPLSAYGEDPQALALQRKVVAEVKSLPGVTSVALTDRLPLSINGNTDWIRFVGRDYNGEHNEVNQRGVSSDYIQTLQANLLQGRTFTDAEDMTQASSRRNQSNSSEEVFSWGGSDWPKIWRHRSESQIDKGDHRHRRRYQRRAVGFGDLASLLLSPQSTS